MTTIDRRGGDIAKVLLTKRRGEGAEYPAHLVGGWLVGFEEPRLNAVNFLLEERGMAQILLSISLEIPRFLGTGFPPDHIGDKHPPRVIVGAGA
jgi:hypothetical protein